MRQPSTLRKHDNSLPWKWIILVLCILSALYFLRSIGGLQGEDEGFGVTIGGSGTFVITDKENKKKDVASGDTFYESDTLFSVISGTAELNTPRGKIWIDKNSDISHNESASGGYLLSQGKIWIEANDALSLSLKHIDVRLTKGDIALIEQQRVYSIVYILSGDAQIEGSGRQTILKTGKRIMVSQSNLINPGTTLESLIGDIDESIQQNIFFLARNGKTLLEAQNLSSDNSEGSGTINSIISSGTTSTNSINSNKTLIISSPIDGSVITAGSVIVEGKSLSPQVKKVVINDQSLSIHSSNSSFRSSPIPLGSPTVDIVYKTFDAGNNLLEKGVLTVYSEGKESGTEKLIPKTFPVNDKEFRILSPTENPYKTSLSAVTVSGSVPKGVVEYITVNNFRLKKFVPKSTSWYYYANVSYQTMIEGFNLYEIRFYGENDTLLSTQLFTIIKENPLTVSGE